MNQKISTGLGVVLIIIIAVTAIYFIWFFKKDRNQQLQNNEVVASNNVSKYKSQNKNITSNENNQAVDGQRNVQTECEKAGGKLSKIKECDGSESDYCQLTEKIHCYADMVKNGKCIGVEFSEEWYKNTGDGMTGTGSGPRVLCDGLK